jgi:hypothetical protein
MGDGSVGDVDADDGEIARFEFKDVGTTAKRGRLRTVGVRVGTESSHNHSASILDYSKVTVKRIFCKAWVMPNIGHHQAVCAETIRLLKAERERRKLSGYAVWKRSGVSQSMLSLVERGLRNPTLELMLRIADGIGVDLATFIKKAQTIKRRAAKKR